MGEHMAPQVDVPLDKRVSSMSTGHADLSLKSSVLARTVTSITPAVRFESMVKEELEGNVAPSIVRRSLRDILQISPQLRSENDIEEIEHALTKWSRYGTDLPQPTRLELCQYMGFASFMPGDVVFNQGDTGDHFYIILSGAVDVLVCEDEDSTLEFQGHGRRRATCKCALETELFVVDIKDFRRILQPLQQGSLRSKIAFLKEVPETQWLPISTLESLAVVLTEKIYAPKSVVYYQGNEMEDIFFVFKGNVKMIRELPMDRESRVLSSQTSSIPIWLQDNKLSAPQPSSSLKRQPRPAHRPPACTPKSPRHALHTPKHKANPHQHQNSSMQKPKGNKYMGFIAPRTKPGNSSYHDLSLEVIQSLTPQRTGSRPNSRPSSKIAARVVNDGRPSIRPSSSKVAAVPTNTFADKPHSRDDDSSGLISSNIDHSTSSNKGAPSSKRLPQGLNRHAAFGSSVGSNVKGCSTAAVGRAAKQPAAGLRSSTAGSAVISPRNRSADTSSIRSSAMTANSAGSLTTSSSKDAAAKSGKAATAMSSNKAGSAGRISHKLTAQKTFRFEDLQEEDEELKAAAQPELPVLSEASLTHRIVQQLDFTGSHHDDHHLFLEVDNLSKGEFFGDMCLTKRPAAPTTAVIGNVSTTLLVVSKWDLMKRAPKELVDHILERAEFAAIDDQAVREQYKQAKKWQRFKSAMVKDVLHRAKAVKRNNPVNVWKAFRDENPLLAMSDQPWKPNGARGISIASPP